MRYDGKIREKLKLVRLNNKKIEYELSYLLSPNCRTFTALKKDEIINYVDEYFFSKHQIYFFNFINDFIVFNISIYYVFINLIKQNDFGQFVMMVIAIITVLVSIIKFHNLIIDLILTLMLLAIAYLVHFLTTTCSHSESNKLKVINNVIYTLEAIKEDMDKNGNSRAKYKSMQNKYSPRLCMREKDVKKN